MRGWSALAALAAFAALLLTPQGCVALQRAALPMAERLQPRALFRVPTDEPVYVLTIDDGPSARTHEILDLLAAHDAHATFFLLTGDLDEAGVAAMRRAVAEGHEIALHGERDRKPTALDGDAFAAMVARSDRALRRIAEPAPFYRPGRGAFDAARMDAALVAGGHRAPLGDERLYVLASLIPWDAGGATETGDPRRNADRARRYADQLAAGLRPGVIVVFHDGDGEAGERAERLDATLVSLPRFLAAAKARDYRGVTLSEAATYPRQDEPR